MYRLPSAAEFQLDVQRAITNNLTVDVAYVGNRGFKELSWSDLNQPPLGTGWNTPWTATQLVAANLPAGDLGSASTRTVRPARPTARQKLRPGRTTPNFRILAT
jgi:hypothetical protein